MPTFPTYRGQLPECLNPLNIRHYFLLIYWTYFRPTALKTYLYNADPNLYKNYSGGNIFHTWSIPAYRNLYIVTPGASVVSSLLVCLVALLIASWFEGSVVSINWLGWLLGILVGIIPGMMYGIASARSAGVTFGAVVGVTIALMDGAVFGPAFAGISVTGDVISGVLSGLAFGAFFGILSGIAGGVMFGVKEGFGLGIAAFIACTIIFGSGMLLLPGLNNSESAMIFGSIASMAAGIEAGVVTGLATGVTSGLVGGVAFGIVFGLVTTGTIALKIDAATGMKMGVEVGRAIVIGAFRLPFYPIQLLLALCNSYLKTGHPSEWDELFPYPLPGTGRKIVQLIKQNEKKGLHFLSDLAGNAFQRWLAQRVLSDYLHKHKLPLHFGYALLISVHSDTYVFAPLSQQGWDQMPSIRQLLLGELGGQFVEATTDRISSSEEYGVYFLTMLLRNNKKTPLTRFAEMLYQLLDIKKVNAEEFNLSSYREICTGLTDYPGGMEIANSFKVMATFLSYKDLPELRDASACVSELSPDDTSIRPKVLRAIANLGEVGAEIATYQDATSRANKKDALLRAGGALGKLDEYVIAEVAAPEQTILRRIIRQWDKLVREAGDKEGRAEVSGPVSNPYIVGNPVIGHLFVGREDILRRLEELWANTEQCPSVVLYGHRRMGKSSILQNLGARFGSQVVVVYFNMQLRKRAASTGELLYILALTLYRHLPKEAQQELEKPQKESFIADNPDTALDGFLIHLDRIRSGRKFIIAIDEFEIIEDMIEQNRLESDLLVSFLGLIETYPWFIMAFAGLHNLEEMRHNYWNPLFCKVTAIPVSFLSPKEAQKLITQPSPNFELDYDLEAVEQIIELTNGQPYLVQLICHTLVTYFNRQTFEEGKERERRFKIEDVNAIIDSPEFYGNGNAYFNGVWVQAENSPPPGQLDILNKLCIRKAISEVELVNEMGLSLLEVQAALKMLENHDVIKKQANGQYVYTVELMRRWVEREKTG